ncbi:hypothetical protein FRX31_012712 [Thalictrum thalictroides]|uniref:Uncharacterized protein n=1 Tax=Thalictrum thalictroides TaxID=46969 RepID=A0A7J6WNL5_THATH|nr:hypothetical protein FRX31_012712 [Thalictrum thalictroides]
MSSSCSYQFYNTRKMVRSRSSIHQTSCVIPSISSAKHGYCDTMRQQLYLSTTNRRGKTNRTMSIRMDLNALNNLPPVPVPSVPSGGSPFPSWSSWMLLTIIPMILPFFKSKWGPLIVIKNKMDTVLQNVEIFAEGIEEVARRVDKIADEMTEKLPEGNFKKAIEMIDAVAEETIKKADCVEELVDKVEEVENKLEDMIEDAIKDKPKKHQNVAPAEALGQHTELLDIIMSATICSLSSYGLCKLQGHIQNRSHGSVVVRQHLVPCVGLSAKHDQFLSDHGLLLLNISHKKHNKPVTNMGINAVNEIHELASSGSNLPEWSNWLWGALLTILLPFMKNKFGPLQQLKNELDTAIHTAEMVTEMVEEVAEKVDEVADEIAEKLPDDMKLKDAIKRVESLAQEAVKDAKQAETVIHKVEEAEKQLEDAALKSVKDQANAINRKGFKV